MRGREEAMRCKEVSLLLIEYQENSLGPEQRRRVEQHLAECDRCTAELKEIEQLYQLLAKEESPSPEESFWVDFLPRVRAMIEAKRKARPGFVFNPRLAAGFLTVLTVAIVGFLMFAPDKENLVERQPEQTSEFALFSPELSSTTDELAEILSVEGEVTLDVLLSDGEGQQLDSIEEILEEEYLDQSGLNAILSELDLEELRKVEENIKALQVGDIL
jgi:hypothetical protein